MSEQFQRCLYGKSIGQYRNSYGTLPPGDCAVCGNGPLHAARKAGNICACSFVRQDHLLCRLCAAMYDLASTGRTRIDIGENPAQMLRIVQTMRALQGHDLL